MKKEGARRRLDIIPYVRYDNGRHKNVNCGLVFLLIFLLSRRLDSLYESRHVNKVRGHLGEISLIHYYVY